MRTLRVLRSFFAGLGFVPVLRLRPCKTVAPLLRSWVVRVLVLRSPCRVEDAGGVRERGGMSDVMMWMETSACWVDFGLQISLKPFAPKLCLVLLFLSRAFPVSTFIHTLEDFSIRFAHWSTCQDEAAALSRCMAS